MIPQEEINFGIEVYGTSTEQCRAKIRQSTEDFTVVEIINPRLLQREREKGTLPVLLVRKKNEESFSFESKKARQKRIRLRLLGLKDKRSLSFQYALASREIKDKETSVAGYVRKEFARELHAANLFRIRLMEVCDKISDVFKAVKEQAEQGKVPNFFGLQRAGNLSPMTHKIGMHIVKKEFRDAVEMFYLNKKGWYEKKAISVFEKSRDAISALRTVPIRIRRLFVNAYQSYIFNRVLSNAIREGIDIGTAERGEYWCRRNGLFEMEVHGPFDEPAKGSRPMIKLPGYSFKNDNTRFDLITKKVMDEENVSRENFIIKEMPELSAAGGLREACIFLYKAWMMHEYNSATICFILPKGQYATTLLREIIKPDPDLVKYFY